MNPGRAYVQAAQMRARIARSIGTRSRNRGAPGSYARRMKDVASIAAVPGALQSATGAIHRSLNALDQDANVIARSSAVESRDTLQALIDSRQQLLYTKAAAKIIAASDEMQQSIIDIRA